MKFVNPKSVSVSEVTAHISRATSDQEIIDVLLSAIYHCDTQFAGDTLFEAYQKISGPNRLYLGNITCTFLEMHSTNYKVDDFIEEMKKPGPDPTMMTKNIEEATEFKEMFA